MNHKVLKCRTGSMLFALIILRVIMASAQDVSNHRIPHIPPAKLVMIDKGSAAFEVTTNVPGVEVKGKSGGLSGTATVHHDDKNLICEQILVSFPVSSLSTGMKMRDEHMRKYVFARPDGQEPDVAFSAEKTVCTTAKSARDFDCDVAGALSIQGTARPLTVKLHVKEQGNSSEYRASGNGVVQLSAYGIPQPSQLGVKVSNDVSLRLEFTGKAQPLLTSNLGEHQ